MKRHLQFLVIEDEEFLGQTLCQLLRLSGHEAVLATQGRQGIALAEAQQPDVVLCDLGLPGMSGLDVARELSAGERTQHIRLIALSGWGAHEYEAESLHAGFDAYLTKPVEVETIERAVALVHPEEQSD